MAYINAVSVARWAIIISGNCQKVNTTSAEVKTGGKTAAKKQKTEPLEQFILLKISGHETKGFPYTPGKVILCNDLVY